MAERHEPSALDAAPFDVVVFGATASGAIAAIAAAGEGARVALLEPGRHVGGMVSGGLGRTDIERQEGLVGGLSRAFFERVGRAYGTTLAWRFEPSVAERVFRDWLRESGVVLRSGAPLEGVAMERGRISALRAGGEAHRARVFVDASYEGDLLAAAGVSWALGREGRSTYGERWAGRRELLPSPHQFGVPVSPLDDRGRLLPYVREIEELVPVGDGDGRTQAYCFRLCLTQRAELRRAVERPANFDTRRFGLVRGHARALGERARLRDFLGMGSLPNGKTDSNSDGPVSTNLPGAGQDWATGDEAVRRRIFDEHLSWAHGLLYVLQSDPTLPAGLRDEARLWGPTRDEFEETEGWPHQLYVREARRMLGGWVMTEHDLTSRPRKPDAIGIGGYNIDVREVHWVAVPVSRFPELHHETLTEGYLSVPVEPYDVPYRALLPRRDECSNLLVSCCLSASHVAFGSLRMEPQFMLIGHAAGVAAARAARSGLAPADLPVEPLREQLRERGQVLVAPEPKPLGTSPPAGRPTMKP